MLVGQEISCDGIVTVGKIACVAFWSKEGIYFVTRAESAFHPFEIIRETVGRGRGHGAKNLSNARGDHSAV